MSENSESKRIKLWRDEVDKIASLAAEKTSAIIAKGLLAEIKKIREKLESIEEELSTIRSLLESSVEKREGISTKESRRGRRSLRDYLVEALKTEGFIIVSNASRKLNVNPNIIVRQATSVGAIVINAGGDTLIISERAFQEFKRVLVEIKSSDPEEASRMLGKYSNIFNMLRRAGMIIYNYKDGKWSIIE
ncbi:MAG: hypothetical protein QXR02_05755 [Acidilobaceae archaeon]